MSTVMLPMPEVPYPRRTSLLDVSFRRLEVPKERTEKAPDEDKAAAKAFDNRDYELARTLYKMLLRPHTPESIPYASEGQRLTYNVYCVNYAVAELRFGQTDAALDLATSSEAKLLVDRRDVLSSYIAGLIWTELKAYRRAAASFRHILSDGSSLLYRVPEGIDESAIIKFTAASYLHAGRIDYVDDLICEYRRMQRKEDAITVINTVLAEAVSAGFIRNCKRP